MQFWEREKHPDKWLYSMMRKEAFVLLSELKYFARKTVNKTVNTMGVSKCEYCQKEYVKKTHNRKYCSKKCLWRALNKKPYKKTLRSRISRSISSRLSEVVGCKADKKEVRGWITKFCKSRLGYTWQQFIDRIESTFSDGMTWGNYGEWQIDHIIPIAVHNNDHKSILSSYRLNNLMARWATTSIAKKYNSAMVGNTNKGSRLILSNE